MICVQTQTVVYPQRIDDDSAILAEIIGQLVDYVCILGMYLLKKEEGQGSGGDGYDRGISDSITASKHLA